ncbi:hypothetical protein MchiMG62_00660 [Methanoculleus chikugoensis]|uniref:Uncharacterized protein n=1 Tax=Methanoculleus chikugoensis TaxID=118126 RepID=A0ABN5XCZ1_9EURY|nr:hypothetical protein MchiMG62_00660 [Methanoculleus chikugoensis]
MVGILPEGAFPAFSDDGGKPLYRYVAPRLLCHAHTIDNNSYNLLMHCDLGPTPSQPPGNNL